MINNIIKVKKLKEDAIIPKYATKGSAGFDLSSLDEGVIFSGESAIISTGLAFEIPEGYEMQVRSRSGMAFKHGISVLHGIGTIDSDYRGEVKVILINHGDEPFEIRKGDRIAQGVINKIHQVQFVESMKLSSTIRGEGGFGSSGMKVDEVTKPNPIVQNVGDEVLTEEQFESVVSKIVKQANKNILKNK